MDADLVEMERLDRLVGFWIRNLPYALEWNKDARKVGWRRLERVYRGDSSIHGIHGVSFRPPRELFEMVNGRKHVGADPLFLLNDTEQCSDVRRFFRVRTHSLEQLTLYVEGKRISSPTRDPVFIEMCTPEAQIALSLGPSSTNTIREEYYEDDGVQANALEALIQMCVRENVSEDAITDVIDVDCVVNACKEGGVKINYTLQEWLTMISVERKYTNVITNKVETQAPLHYLPLFLSKYLDLSKASDRERDAVMRAALVLDSLELFMRIYTDTTGRIHLWEACKYDAVKIVEWLLIEKKVEPTASNNLAIRIAAGRDSAKVMEVLLRDGRADPTVWDNEPLRTARAKGHTEIVQLLLDDGRVTLPPRGRYSLST